MKRDFVDILACPVCKSPLNLEVTEEKDRDIISGSLFCQKCNHKYLITESIPHLLPPDA
jgi:uncharacterized protein YbaR (Trm112 family)